MVLNLQFETFSRSTRMLRTAQGPAITGFLEDPTIAEVMLNPDGRLWIDRLTGWLENTGQSLCTTDCERIIRLVAHHVGAEVHAEAPPLSAELLETGERLEGLLPPIMTSPAFAIRKPVIQRPAFKLVSSRFSQKILQNHIVEHGIRQETLKLAFLAFKLLQPPGIRKITPPNLALSL